MLKQVTSAKRRTFKIYSKISHLVFVDNTPNNIHYPFLLQVVWRIRQKSISASSMISPNGNNNYGDVAPSGTIVLALIGFFLVLFCYDELGRTERCQRLVAQGVCVATHIVDVADKQYHHLGDAL